MEVHSRTVAVYVGRDDNKPTDGLWGASYPKYVWQDRVGDFVGTESAQAVGEPSAQLTISLVNQGGTAGAAINDGVKRFSSLLDGSVKDCALVAPRNGYVHIEPLGEAVTLSIKPIDKSCTLCNGCSFAGDCPTVSRETLPPCAFPKVVPANLLVVKEDLDSSLDDFDDGLLH